MMLQAWRRRRAKKAGHEQLVARLDRLARQQEQEERQRQAVEDIKRTKARARHDIELMPFKGGVLAVLKAISGCCFHYRGYCAHAVEDIARKAGVSVRSAQRALRELEENGVIERVVSGRGRGITSIYRVCRSVIRDAAQRIRKAAKRLMKKGDSRAPRKGAKALLAYIESYIRSPNYRVPNVHGGADCARQFGNPTPWTALEPAGWP